MKLARRGAHACLLAVVACPLLMAGGNVQAQSGDPEEYVDRIIDPSRLAPLPAESDQADDPEGLPRSTYAEAIASRTERNNETFGEFGIGLGGTWETEEFGTLSLDALLLHSDRPRDGERRSNWRATLWQRGYYLNNDWRADNGLGVLNTPLPDLLRNQYRFFLPSVPFVGASTSISHINGVNFQASGGRAGLFTGARVLAFDQADGHVGSLGAQWRWSPAIQSSLAFLATDGRIVPDDSGETFFQEGRTEATAFSTRWTGPRDNVQVNLQSSSGYLGSASGAWLDAESRRQRYVHNYGAYRLGDDLAWGAMPINNDVQGLYYRLGYQHARWTWNASVEDISSISDGGFDGQYGTAFARYQANPRLGIGANLSLRHSSLRTDGSLRVFADRRTSWGLSRAQIDYARSGDAGEHDWQVQFDQDLPMRQGSRLSLSLAHGSVQYSGEPERSDTTSLAAYGGIDIGSRVKLDGSVRWTHGSGPDAFRGGDINLSASWRIAPRWQLAATLYQNEGSRRSPFVLDPLADQTFVRLPSDRSFFLTLRYDRQAGTPASVIGGGPQSAAGGIRGSVFLDENGDGIRSATELPAANVTVILDGRYAVRTDSNGEFEFARVAVGAHTIEVVPDNLPLPWFIGGDGDRRAVEVRVRDTSRVDIGARRQR
ncbi:carboxypeptidase-like regulatory domain-containing protein [Arenimonas sp.]|uniref:carboxypeptidase-like regulatory domain-containing protein n=1 Tax=Arenimonas sp. TaxID=1872635 RepID=UPI0025EDDDC3|nr:carboxypeptidase-like regulatory domain-containing protein [Arenimonas sp.]